jgi:hypothetical protein
MNMKQFGIAMLSAMVLLTVASAPWSGQQSGSSYDPWLDYDGNGKIDVGELQRLAESYGSLGDATRNVTVAGHVTAFLRLGGGNFSIPAGTSWYSDVISVDGYATVTVLIMVSSATSSYAELFACDNSGYSWYAERITFDHQSGVKTYNVMSPRIRIRIVSGNAITAEAAVYLVA